MNHLKFFSVLVLGSLLFSNTTIAQIKNKPKKLVDIAVATGSNNSVAASLVYNWSINKKKHWLFGLGIRSTTAWGNKVEFTTAPAKLARTNTIPFAIVFAGQKIENWDTLVVNKPATTSLNLTANVGYNFNKKWGVGLNIDLLGFTLGSKSKAVLISNGIETAEAVAKPANFNVLLTGDLDYGTLNSEFYAKYAINDKWNVRLIYSFLFTEYVTTTIKQTAPNGTLVDRFRSKANNIGFGLTYNF